MSADRLFDLEPLVPPAPEHDLDTATLGAIAEQIVGARLMARGLDVSRPTVDVRGVDLVVAGARVQVRSTQRPRICRPRGGTEYLYYYFNGASGQRKRLHIGTTASRCDVFAFYAHDTGQLWLARSDAVAARWRSTTITIRPDERTMLDDFAVFEVRS